MAKPSGVFSGTWFLALIIICSRFQRGLFATVLPADDPHGCKKLKAEGIGDCAACISSLPEEETSSAFCVLSASEEVEAERAAIFQGKGGTKLWNETTWLFGTDTVHEVGIYLSNETWEFLRTDPGKEEYTNGDVEIAGEKVREIGIRFKGATGSLRQCLDEKVCEKLSWKFKFNKFDKKQTFYGLKKLMLHAANDDLSEGMRERLTNSLWREMGVPAPRQNFITAKLIIDAGTSKEQTYNLGLHVVTEQLDGRFTDAFQSGSGDFGNGNLFKEAWPGFGDVSAETFIAALKTNEDEGNVSRLVAFGLELQQVTNDYDLALLMKKYTRAEEMARYWVVDRATENWDGPINFRTEGSSYVNHNYYLYQEDDPNIDNQRFRIYAWDPDGTWINDDTLNGYLGYDSVSERKAWDMPVGTCDACQQCQVFSSGIGGKHMPAVCFSTVRAFARGLRQQYMDAALELLKGPFQKCRLRSKLDRWKDVARPYIEQDVADGLYPPVQFCEYKDKEWAKFDPQFSELRDVHVRNYVSRFRESVSCDRGYNSDDWAPLSAANNLPIAPYPSHYSQHGPWEPNFLTRICDAPNYNNTPGVITATRRRASVPRRRRSASSPRRRRSSSPRRRRSSSPRRRRSSSSSSASSSSSSSASVIDLTGSFRATVSDPTAFASNPLVKVSVQEAIADSNLGRLFTSLGIVTPWVHTSASMVEILDISVDGDRRLAGLGHNGGRRLAGDVHIKYKLTIAEGDALLNQISARLIENGVENIDITSVVADDNITSSPEQTQEFNITKEHRLVLGLDAIIFLGLFGGFLLVLLVCCSLQWWKARKKRKTKGSVIPSSDA